MRKNTSIKLLLKTQIIEKYVKTITDFLLLFGQSSLIDESSNIIYTGITTIHRVFEYVLSKTHSLEKTLYYAQKASYYYLEYMEQIINTNSLNQIDAILFVYKKTIFDLYDGENNSFNTMTNIMTLNEEPLDQNDNIDWTVFLTTILKSLNIILFWSNSQINNNDRIEICKLYTLTWLKQTDNIDITNSYLEIIQQKLLVNGEPQLYMQLLKEITDKMLSKPKQSKSKILADNEKNELYLMKFYIDETTLHAKFNENMKEFVNWLYA